jgi:DNA-binding transcriptional LysR family regulator
VRIGTKPSAGEHVLPSVCAELLRGSPGLFNQVVVGLSDVLLAAVARSDLVGYLPTGALGASGTMREWALLRAAPLHIKRTLGVISRPGAYLPPVAARLKKNTLRRVAPRSVE